MSESNGNGGVMLKWVHIILLLFGQAVITAGGIGAMYASMKFQVDDHERRIIGIEKKQEDNFIPRSEYDKRHEDLIRQMQELREQMRDLERKIH